LEAKKKQIHQHSATNWSSGFWYSITDTKLNIECLLRLFFLELTDLRNQSMHYASPFSSFAFALLNITEDCTSTIWHYIEYGANHHLCQFFACKWVQIWIHKSMHAHILQIKNVPLGNV
jgi:hypothetical protein